MSETELTKVVELPKWLVESLGLPDGERPRISYLSLANDVARVQQYWARGQSDPRSLKATYAGMFFELVEALDGRGLLFSLHHTTAPPGQPVEIVPLTAGGTRAKQADLVDAILERLTAFRPHLLIVSPSVTPEILPRAAKICPVVFYAHSLFWPAAWDQNDATLTQRFRRQVRIWRTRRHMRAVRGVIASSALCLTQFRAMVRADLPQEIIERQFLAPVTPARPQSAKNLLYVGGLDTFSGADGVLAAFQTLRRSVPDASLHLIGDGPLAAEFAARADKMPGVRVTIGYDADAQIAALKQAGLLVVPEPPETLNGTATFLPEALVFGVPALISSATPVGPAETSGCMVFRAGDQTDLAAKLILLNTDPAAYARLLKNLPLDSSPYFDRSQSWGSACARMLAKLGRQS